MPLWNPQHSLKFLEKTQTEPVLVPDTVVNPPKKRRKTISSKYKADEQKLLTYGGKKIHVQVTTIFELC